MYISFMFLEIKKGAGSKLHANRNKKIILLRFLLMNPQQALIF